MNQVERYTLIMLALALKHLGERGGVYRPPYADRQEVIDWLLKLPITATATSEFLKYFDYLASDPQIRRELARRQREFDEWSTEDHDRNPEFWESLERMIRDAKANIPPEDLRRAKEFRRNEIKFHLSQAIKSDGFDELRQILEEVRDETLIDT